jgi:hypothetical protein
MARLRAPRRPTQSVDGLAAAAPTAHHLHAGNPTVSKRAGFYLVAKYGTQRSTLTLINGVPGLGDVVSMTVDAGLTRSMGEVPRRRPPRSVAEAIS